ncbi:MAG: GerMN domain-containing protein [Roseburia sp.]|nr:GerMN domain-containing protein [Ruminococcus sp.]MCM1153787.1 GerMN domain-containing protein [Roseburia sp.]MCM1242732.1 GerMN domain-containing protein [Roseburia sp.]
MKNRSWLVLFPLVIVLSLVSCGSRAEEASAMEEVPDVSASDLLVDSLEYLLDEEDGLVKEEDIQLIEVEEIPEEEEKPQVEVMIYYGNGASDELNAEVSTMEQVSAENLVDALVRHNIVSLGTKVLSFEEKEADGEKILYLDLSKTFREYLKTMTQKGENIILSSVTATFLEAYGADKIVITIDGEVLETEHATYAEPFSCAPGELLAE